jgi:hypothetical protein
MTNRTNPMTTADAKVELEMRATVEKAIAEVNGRFKNWTANQGQLGYARAVGAEVCRILEAPHSRTEALVEALKFYAEEWTQDVDAEQTVHGWEGRIGELEPTLDLRNDAGGRAREALAMQSARPIDQQEAVICRHEPYQGKCAHCDIPFRDGRPVVETPEPGPPVKDEQ